MPVVQGDTLDMTGWRLTTGGTEQFCTCCSTRTTGPTWKFWEGVLCKMTVCVECADKTQEES